MLVFNLLRPPFAPCPRPCRCRPASGGRATSATTVRKMCRVGGGAWGMTLPVGGSRSTLLAEYGGGAPSFVRAPFSSFLQLTPHPSAPTAHFLQVLVAVVYGVDALLYSPFYSSEVTPATLPSTARPRPAVPQSRALT